EDAADARQPFAADFALGAGRFPEAPAPVAPATNLMAYVDEAAVDERNGLAEEHVVYALGVGLHVARIAAQHTGDERAGLLGRVFEEDVIAVGNEHEEVATAARLAFLVRSARGLYGDASGVSGHAKGGAQRIFARCRDNRRAQGRPRIFGPPA